MAKMVIFGAKIQKNIFGQFCKMLIFGAKIHIVEESNIAQNGQNVDLWRENSNEISYRRFVVKCMMRRQMTKKSRGIW